MADFTTADPVTMDKRIRINNVILLVYYLY